MAEQSFYSDFNMYGSCLTYMGFDPGNEIGNRYYAVGISNATAAAAVAYSAAINSGLNSTDCPNLASGGVSGNTNITSPLNSTVTATFFVAGKGIGANIASTSTFIPATMLGSQSDQTTMIFTLGAGGVIDGNFTTSANASAIQISDRKIFTMARNGY
jgi:hypothetical protein